jgi:hypothetical protein
MVRHRTVCLAGDIVELLVQYKDIVESSNLVLGQWGLFIHSLLLWFDYCKKQSNVFLLHTRIMRNTIPARVNS